MSLQTSRSLIKKCRKILSGKKVNAQRKITEYIYELPKLRENVSNYKCNVFQKDDMLDESVML